MTADLAGIERIMRRGRVIMLAGLLGLVAIYILAIFYTPSEQAQGAAIKILYVHAPAAWAMRPISPAWLSITPRKLGLSM